MSKWLIALLLLATTSFGATEVMYQRDRIDNSAGVNGGIHGENQRVAMDARGNFWIFTTFSRDPDTLRMIVFPRWGASYYEDTAFYPSTISGISQWWDVTSFDTTVVVVWERYNSSVGNTVVIKCTDTSTYVFDTALSGSDIGTPTGGAAAMIGWDLPMIGYRQTEGFTDTFGVSLPPSRVFPSTNPWNYKVGYVNSTTIGSGWRSMTYYRRKPWGFLAYEGGIAKDNWALDSNYAVEINTNYFVANNPESQMMLMVSDSDGVKTNQPGEAASTKYVYVETFKVRYLGSGSPTEVSGTVDTLVTTSEMALNMDAYPRLSHLWGTDTVFCFYFFWADTLNTDSVDIAFNVSPDRGATWGARQILQPAVNGRNKTMLNVPSVLYKSPKDEIVVYAAYTPQETVDDSLYVVIDTLNTANDGYEILREFKGGGIEVAYTDTGNPSTNYGNSTNAYSAWVNGFNFRKTALIRPANIDRLTIPSDSIAACSLFVYFVSETYAGSVYAHEMLRAWTESGVTWLTYDGTNPWTKSGGLDSAGSTDIGTTLSSVSTGNAVWRAFDIPVSVVQGWLTAGTSNGILLRCGTNAAQQYTTEDAGGRRPYFKIDIVTASASSRRVILIQ